MKHILNKEKEETVDISRWISKKLLEATGVPIKDSSKFRGLPVEFVVTYEPHGLTVIISSTIASACFVERQGMLSIELSLVNTVASLEGGTMLIHTLDLVRGEKWKALCATVDTIEGDAKLELYDVSDVKIGLLV